VGIVADIAGRLGVKSDALFAAADAMLADFGLPRTATEPEASALGNEDA